MTMSIKNITFTKDVEAKGNFNIDEMLTSRGIDIPYNLAPYLDENQLKELNPRFDVVLENTTLHYSIKKNHDSFLDVINVEVNFPFPVKWMS